MKNLNNYINEQLITERFLYSKLAKHMKAGFICISASRSENDKSVNNENTARLKKEIQDSGFSYSKIDGGYREKNDDTGKYVDVDEASFMVYRYLNMKGDIDRDGTGKLGDFDKLKKLGLKWCGEYKQQSVLICPPEGQETEYKANPKVDNSSAGKTSNPVYLNKDGQLDGTPGDAIFTREPSFDNMMKEFYTKMGSRCNHRFTLMPITVDAVASSISEMRSRTMTGEVCILAGYGGRHQND